MNLLEILLSGKSWLLKGKTKAKAEAEAKDSIGN